MPSVADRIFSWLQRFLSVTPRANGTGSVLQARSADWSSQTARSFRYGLLWASYESTLYEDIHQWSEQYKAEMGLYQEIDAIENPAYRLGEFWATHLIGGALDPEAGDGETTPSALPIKTENDNLRPAIARFWKDSNWQIEKSGYARLGAVMGDVGIKIIDDEEIGKVYLEVIDPREIVSYSVDRRGNCRGYELEEILPDPEQSPESITSYLGQKYVVFRERVYRDGDSDIIVYETYKDNELYAWNGKAARWTQPYGFVPFVLTPHMKVLPKSPWGMAEAMPGLPKFRTADHVSSLLRDFIGKSTDAPWLFAGVAKPLTGPTVDGRDRTTEKPRPRREEIPALYAGAEARAQALVAGLDISAVVKFIEHLESRIERDYPELRPDIESAIGDASGKALRVARQRVEAKAVERRSNYDNAIVRAQQMAIAIGGYRGYAKEYRPFDLSSYQNGKLDHSIGNRSVFQVDPEDTLDLRTKFWANAESADRAGCPLPIYLEREGWSEAEIAEVVAMQEEYKKKGMAVGRTDPPQPKPVNDAHAEALQTSGAR